MRILYGVQATGNGHITRSREVIRALRAAGHIVLTLFSGRPADQLWDVEDFHPCLVRRGLTFVAEGGRIRPFRTARQLRIGQFFRDIEGFSAEGFDLVICDFEPISAQIARQERLTSIGIAHQYSFRYPVPAPSGHWLGRAVTRLFAPVDVPIGLHWNHFGQPILPPIIPELPDLEAVPRKAAVYLAYESEENLARLLGPLRDWDFYIYRDIPEPRDEGHLHFRPFSRKEFQRDLATSEAVVTNSGFELVSESVTLGKKVLVFPLKGQFEQQANALAIERLGIGRVVGKNDPGRLKEALESAPPPRLAFPPYCGDLVRWIESGNWSDVRPLSSAVWEKVEAARPFRETKPGTAPLLR